MANEPHQVDKFRYPVDPELRRLEFLLGDLAAEWRGSYDDPEKQQALVNTYHETLHTLYARGWDAELDMESHLPRELMPEAYRKRVPPQQLKGKNLLSKKYEPPKTD